MTYQELEDELTLMYESKLSMGFYAAHQIKRIKDIAAAAFIMGATEVYNLAMEIL